MADLKTDYKDDVLNISVNENRRYRMIDNGDGTVSFEDVTEYDQVGDNYGALEINETNEIINGLDDDVSQIADELSDKLNKSGDSLLAMGDRANAGSPAIHLRNNNREIRDALTSTGDFVLFDYTDGSVKNILLSYKNGINTFGGVGLRVNNGVAQYSPNNGTSWLNFKNPTGTKSITANGTYDVTDYASAQVTVGPLIQQVGPAVYVASQGYSWNGAEVGRYYAITISIHQGYNQTFEPPASMSGCQVISTTGVVLTYTPVATAERDRMRMYFVKATSTTLSITNVGQSAANVAWLAMRVGW